VSLLVEATSPVRIVERDLTSSHEADVVTTIEPCELGARLTETFTGWLPAGPGRVVDSSGIAALMRTRLAVVKNLAEAGVEPQRDPRTGFLPPGTVPDLPPPTGDPVNLPVGGVETVGTAPSTPGSVPSSVLLTPPHVAAPAAGYDLGSWLVWGEEGFSTALEATWW
jgi:hypothetical protein